MVSMGNDYYLNAMNTIIVSTTVLTDEGRLPTWRLFLLADDEDSR